MFRNIRVLLVSLVLAACAAGPSVYVNQDPAANFTPYRTYNFEAPLGTDRPEYASVLSQFLKLAASREMTARGYTLSDQPDLLVNFNVQTKDKISSMSIPSGPRFGGYYGYRSGYYGVWGGYDTQVTQYTEGTLTIDIVDATRKQLVWEGTVVGRVRDEDRRNLQPLIDRVVTQVFSEYPHRAAVLP